MKFVDVENLSAADLKEQRAVVVDSLEAEPAELKARYVQARLDAKQRDEKMAEQGKTITLLQDSLERETAARLSAEKRVFDVGQELQRMASSHNAQAEQWTLARQNLEGEIGQLKADALALQDRCDRLKLQCCRNADAINTAAGALNKAIASQQIETADQG